MFAFKMFESDLPIGRCVDVSYIERRFCIRIMKSSPYIVIPLHHRPDLMQQCCDLLNLEWKRSETARLKSLNTSCDSFPTCLILMNTDVVVGHCKISLVQSMSNSCMIESVLIDQEFRNRGLGSLLMKGAEEYMEKRGIKNVYLMTKGQEDFYRKNGYHVCEPIDVLNCIDFATDPITKAVMSEMLENDIKTPDYPDAPPPPPLPNFAMVPNFIFNSRTFMFKKL